METIWHFTMNPVSAMMNFFSRGNAPVFLPNIYYISIHSNIFFKILLDLFYYL